MKRCILFIIILVCGGAVFSQTTTKDTIAIAKKFFSASLDFKGDNVSLGELEKMCSPYVDAMDEIKLAKRNNNPALLVSLVGAVMIGYAGVKWAMGDDFKWQFAAGGVVLIGVTIPLHRSARNHKINAARIYNYEIRH
jgi:hypothetical protein